MNKKGRPSKYNQKYHDKWVYALAKLGYTDKEIAKELDISESTLNLWKKHESFIGALKKGKNSQDDLVENSLLRNALGYEFEEKEYIVVDNKEILKTKRVRYMKPDTIAAIFWLKNRRPGKWRDKKEIDIHEKSEYEKELEKLSDEELIERRNKIEEELRK